MHKKKRHQHLKYKTEVNFKGVHACTIQCLGLFKGIDVWKYTYCLIELDEKVDFRMKTGNKVQSLQNCIYMAPFVTLALLKVL